MRGYTRAEYVSSSLDFQGIYHKWHRLKPNIANNARSDDSVQSIIYALAAEKNIEFKVVYNTEEIEEELDTFLSTFQIH